VTTLKPYRLIAPILYGTCIYLLSSIPGNLSSNSNPSFLLSLVPSSLQNLLHIPLFAGLTSCLLWALAPIKRQKQTYLIVLAVSLVFAVSDEVHQMYVPGRFGSMSDAILDSIGIVLSIFIHKKKFSTN